MVLASVVLAFASGALRAAEVFRYKDENGVIVWSQTLPPEYAVGGYRIYDRSGRLIREVAPQLTEEELAQRARDERELIEAQQRAAAAYERDKRLMRLYASADDVERAKERRLASIENAINTMRGNVQRLRVQRQNLESQAADVERTGARIPQSILDELDSLDRQISERREEIETRTREMADVVAEFDADAERVRELYSESS